MALVAGCQASLGLRPRDAGTIAQHSIDAASALIAMVCGVGQIALQGVAAVIVSLAGTSGHTHSRHGTIRNQQAAYLESDSDYC